MTSGDTIVMFTDGVTEAVSLAGEEFGEDRIVAAVRGGVGLSAAQMTSQILGEVDSFAAGAPQYDDITVVVVRVL